MSSVFKHALAAAGLVGAVLSGGWHAACAADATAAVHVRGARTLLPMAQYMAESYMSEHPGATIAVSGGGTVRGYKSVMDGTAEVGLVSGPVPDDLQKEIDRQRIKLTRVIAAYNAIVAIVHPANALDSLNPEQLRHIFTGRINNWKYVGGRNLPIHVYVGTPSDGITETWRETVIGANKTYTPKGLVLDTEARVKRIAADPLAITFIAFGNLNSSVKPLKVNDVAATTYTVLDGSYVLGAPLMLVTAEKPAALTKDFVQYFSTPRKRLRFAGIITVETVD